MSSVAHTPGARTVWYMAHDDVLDSLPADFCARLREVAAVLSLGVDKRLEEAELLAVVATVLEAGGRLADLPLGAGRALLEGAQRLEDGGCEAAGEAARALAGAVRGVLRVGGGLARGILSS